jgi:hypothetical protein
LRDRTYDDGTRPWINPIFIVPESVRASDLDGLKLGHFSRKKKGLVVMIAVPGSFAIGQGAIDFVMTSLQNAIRIAAEHFESKKISFPL